MTARKPALALLLDGLPTDWCLLANKACPGFPARPPQGGTGMRGQKGGILGGGAKGTSVVGRG